MGLNHGLRSWIDSAYFCYLVHLVDLAYYWYWLLRKISYYYKDLEEHSAGASIGPIVDEQWVESGCRLEVIDEAEVRAAHVVLKPWALEPVD